MSEDSNAKRKPITFVANAYSVHIRQWLKLARPLDVEIEIATAEPAQPGAPEGHRVLHLAPRSGVRTEVCSYPLEEANRALDDLREGRVRGSAVLEVS